MVKDRLSLEERLKKTPSGKIGTIIRKGISILMVGIASYLPLDVFLSRERENQIGRSFEKLLIEKDNLKIYMAGSSFPKNFARDGLIAAIQAEDPDMLRDQLWYCKSKQGI